ncbi:menaquinone biosynthetic enzyme MqnA/MqnD family protein [Desulfoplanes formicivorans]|nr:menaquinone biosynthesis protein [Desulfoplanes formicivorans]
MPTLNIGKIDYLNVWPMFQLLEHPEDGHFDHTLVPGHPSFLNELLARGEIDVSPSSAFEYLLHAEQYQILPGLSISSDGPVQSVLLVSPVPREDLPSFLAHHHNRVNVTGASATSVALLKVLWSLAWGFDQPQWQVVEPGEGLGLGLPFLEIGDRALRIHADRPRGWHITDLGEAWKQWTGLPFVFALWIVRKNLFPERQAMLTTLAARLLDIKKQVPDHLEHLLDQARNKGFSREVLRRYWQIMSYELGEQEQASLALYAHLCTRLGLLPGCPALNKCT